MNYSLFVILTLFCSFSFAKKNTLDFSGESAIQYREDRLRERVNENQTDITNLSIVAEKTFDDDKRLKVEILGEESRVTEEFNLTIGELYYNQEFNFDEREYLNFNYTLGFMKLKYGLLNPIDGNFAQLPNYYQFLFGLPRGIDVGLAFEKKITKALSFGVGGYFGQTVRDSDGFQPESIGLPYNTYLDYKPFDWLDVRAHYYSRQFVNTPEISGLGFDFKTNFRAGLFDLSFNGEAWSINSIAESIESDGLVYLINPKVSFKGLYVEGFYSDESWSFTGDSGSVGENYLSSRLGYSFSEYFIFETEYLIVENSELSTRREESFQARVYFNWEM